MITIKEDKGGMSVERRSGCLQLDDDQLREAVQALTEALPGPPRQLAELPARPEAQP
jgi:hypothetical protein